MRRLFAVVCMVLLSGCAQVKDAAQGAADTLTNPAGSFMEELRHILSVVIEVLAQFFAHLDPTNWF